MHIYTRKIVEGESIPGIVHNGEYFLTPFGIYEDGTISCWERHDLSQFQEALKRGWAVPQIPDGKNLSIFQLGVFPIQQAKWLYDAETYYEHILSIIKKLNPEMQNLYTATPRIIEKWKKAHVRWSDEPEDCKINSFYRITDGKSKFIFYQQNQTVSLTFLTAYADKTFCIGTEPDKCYSFAEIQELFQKKILFTTLSSETWVNIAHLGKVLLNGGHSVSVKEKLKELQETAKRLAKEPTAHDTCIQAYHHYLEFPCEETRKALRTAYEAVPEHERIYLGDMDTRDSDYQRILFHPEQKREV